MLKKKTLSFVLFGTLTLLLGAVSIGLYLIDWNQYRDTLSGLASERLGMRVELAGDLNLGLLPRPTVSAQAVRLSPLQRDYNDTIATADRIDMHLGLAALLRGSMELQSLAFEGLSAGLVETAGGWTIEGWPATASGDGSADQSTLLSLDRFRIKSGSITVSPLRYKPVVFDGVDVSLSGRLPGGPLDMLGTAIIDGSAISVIGKVVPTRTIGSTSVRFDVDVADSRLEFSGRLSDSGNITGRFQANGQNLKKFADFSTKTLGADGNYVQVPPLPYRVDIQIERSTGDITRLVSRQLQIGDTRGNLDLTVAEQGDIFHLTGNGSFGIIALDQWIEGQTVKPAANVSANDAENRNGLPLAGNIDISIEGIEFRGGLAQQVQASISFSDGEIALDQLRATLPGASRLAYIADTNMNNIGAIKFQSGGVQEVFKWIGLPISDSIPAGRLSTADIEGQLAIVDEAWILSGLSGTVDTTGIEAEFSGSIHSFVPNAVKIKLDQLNLDAYWPNPQFNDAPGEGYTLDTQFVLEIGQLRWLQQSFDEVSISGRLAENLTSISNMALRHMGGSLTGNLSKQDVLDRPSDVEMTIAFVDWQTAALAQLSPELASLLTRFSEGKPVTGSVFATGPQSELQVRLGMASGDNALEFAGTADATENRSVQLQGSFTHANIGPLLELGNIVGFAGNDRLSVDLQASIDGTYDAFSFSANGLVAGGQSNFSGTYDNERISADMSVTIQAGTQGGLDVLSRQYGINLDSKQLRRLRLTWSKDEDGWRIDDLDARNGNVSIAGNLGSAAGVVTGSLSMSNMDIDSVYSGSGSDTSGERSLPTGGAVAIQASNVSLMGQILNASAAKIKFNPSGAIFEMGQSATLNGGLLQTTIEFDQQVKSVSLDISAASLDIGPLLQNMGGVGGFTGSVSTSLKVSASLADDDNFLETIKGEGRIEGGGGAMHFFAAKELIAAVSNGTSSASFLKSVGDILRGGDTDFVDLTGSFRMDNGVALVDEIVASGEWGNLALGGQVNMPGDYVNMTGELSLSQPLDAPTIPVVYEGRLSAPNVRWTSRALEQFAIAGIERRLRSRIFVELEQAGASQPEGIQKSPGAAVFGVASSLLEKLRARQKEAKRIEEEKRAAESAPKDEPSSPGSVRQMPL